MKRWLARRSRDARPTTSHQLNVLSWPAYLAREANPYTSLLCDSMVRSGAEVAEFSARRALSGDYRIWHIHWPERALVAASFPQMLVKCGIFGALIPLSRLRGARIVWTVHNLRSHERAQPKLERVMMWWFTRQLSGFIALSPSGLEAAQERYPSLARARSVVIPHGHYLDVYPNTVERDEARQRLGVESSECVFLFFGQLRAYKNASRLLQAFAELKSLSACLIVAGQPASAEIADDLRRLAAMDARVRLDLVRIPDDQIQIYMNAADLVVLPYVDVLNSGTAILALSFGRPVLVPHLGAMGDLQALFGADAVRTYDGQISPKILADAVGTSSDSAALRRFVRRQLDWDAIGRQTVAFYEQIASG